MTRTPLTVSLASVLTAAIDGADRPALLATLHPEFGRAIPRPRVPETPGLAKVLPMPRVIPMPRRNLSSDGSTAEPPPCPEPSSAA